MLMLAIGAVFFFFFSLLGLLLGGLFSSCGE